MHTLLRTVCNILQHTVCHIVRSQLHHIHAVECRAAERRVVEFAALRTNCYLCWVHNTHTNVDLIHSCVSNTYKPKLDESTCRSVAYVWVFFISTYIHTNSTTVWFALVCSKHTHTMNAQNTRYTPWARHFTRVCVYVILHRFLKIKQKKLYFLSLLYSVQINTIIHNLLINLIVLFLFTCNLIKWCGWRQKFIAMVSICLGTIDTHYIDFFEIK